MLRSLVCVRPRGLGFVILLVGGLVLRDRVVWMEEGDCWSRTWCMFWCECES